MHTIKRIVIFTFLGAIGFGIGAIGFGAIRIQGWSLELMSSASTPSILGLPTMGAVGGATLGLALWSWRKASLLALLGTIGASIGFIIEVMISVFIQGYGGPLTLAYAIIYGVTPGACIGIALGLTFLDFKRIIGLGLAGALGFGIGMAICYSYFHPWAGWGIPGNFEPWLGWILWGVIGGGFIGATLGYIEGRWPSTSNDYD